MRLRTNAWLSRHAPVGCAMALSMAAGLSAVAQEPVPQGAGPRVLLSMQLPEMPGMSVTVVELVSPPNPGAQSTTERRGHRHPGPVLVYVTHGALRLALEGAPVQVVHAGETFFEPARAHHVIGENASATEPARAIAVMIVPEDEPLSVPEPE